MTIKESIKSRLEYVQAVASDKNMIDEVRKIPKYEFHVHLGGSIRRQTAAELAQKNGISLPCSREEFLSAATPLSFFHGDQLWQLFHDAYKWHWSCIKSCDDLRRIVFEFLEDSYKQGVVHSEFTVSGSYLMNTFPFDEWEDAISTGIDEAKKKYEIIAAAILDISRRFGPENAIENVRLLADKKADVLCGIGMGGDEVKYPHNLFIDAFRLARESNIPSTVHVSEFRNAESTAHAIRDLKPNRLGHALTTVQSEKAYRTLKESGLHVESCPLCNYVGGMGGIDSIAEHPIRKYYDEGIPISINTDDPKIFGFDLIDNYVMLMKEAGFSLRDFENINKEAVEHAFIESSPSPLWGEGRGEGRIS
jgi:adenosine deaminase